MEFGGREQQGVGPVRNSFSSLKPSGGARDLGEARQRLEFLQEGEWRGSGGIGVQQPKISLCFVSVDVRRREVSRAGGDWGLEFPGDTPQTPRCW